MRRAFIIALSFQFDLRYFIEPRSFEKVRQSPRFRLAEKAGRVGLGRRQIELGVDDAGDCRGPGVLFGIGPGYDNLE